MQCNAILVKNGGVSMKHPVSQTYSSYLSSCFALPLIIQLAFSTTPSCIPPFILSTLNPTVILGNIFNVFYSQSTHTDVFLAWMSTGSDHLALQRSTVTVFCV
jgi:hypothetical protein